jgi:glucosamine--fructose-6-phosphate aminotransferase (isomerizing)
MCGIVGYIGNVFPVPVNGELARPGIHTDAATNPLQKPVAVCLSGLTRLEYRGYDSAGILVSNNGTFDIRKKQGKLENLKTAITENPLPDSNIAIGHTRWATHGVPSDENAHPHISSDGKVAIVHNGIIENAQDLLPFLAENGFTQKSQTDTEILCNLIALNLKLQNAEENLLEYAVEKAISQIKGTWAIIAVNTDEPDKIVAARHNSPLMLGISSADDGQPIETYLGSDVLSFIDYTNTKIDVPEDSIVICKAGKAPKIYSKLDKKQSNRIDEFENSFTEITARINLKNIAQILDSPNLFDFTKPENYTPETVDLDISTIEKGGYSTFMEKEIFEDAIAIEDTLAGRFDMNYNVIIDDNVLSDSDIKSIDKIIIIGCGTASNSGFVAKYAIEHWCRIPVEIELAHEFRYRDPIITARTLVVAISQSGETMDTMMALKYAAEQGAKTIAICNTIGASIPRLADATIYTHAGPEIAVASTKAFLGQIVAAYLLGLFLAQQRGNMFPNESAMIIKELMEMPKKVCTLLENRVEVEDIASQISDVNSVIFLGRHVGYPIALEGALKLKEIAYIHAEGFAAGELKHGPIALIEPGQIVIVLIPSSTERRVLFDKINSNIEEIVSRGARVIAICSELDSDKIKSASVEFVLTRPTSSTLFEPLLDIVPLQFFALYMAQNRGLNVDQPRNLAKSVTVE